MEVWSLPAPRVVAFLSLGKEQKTNSGGPGSRGKEQAEHLSAWSSILFIFSRDAKTKDNFLLWPFMFSTLPICAQTKTQTKTKKPSSPNKTKQKNCLISFLLFLRKSALKNFTGSRVKAVRGDQGIIISRLYFSTFSFLLRTSRKVEGRKKVVGRFLHYGRNKGIGIYTQVCISEYFKLMLRCTHRCRDFSENIKDEL